MSRQAGTHGHNALTVYREARRRLNELEPPPECAQLHEAIVQWITAHVEACEVLIRIAEMRTIRNLREVQGRLAEGRAWAGRFNTEYSQVVEELRTAVARALGREVHSGTRSGLSRRLGVAWHTVSGCRLGASGPCRGRSRRRLRCRR